jgi:twitching motility protein PilT
MTRTVRIEVPSRSGPARATATDRLLRAASGHAASELFLMSQARPYIRVDGEIRGLDDETPLQAADIESLLADLTPEPWRDAVRRGDPAEWLMEFAEVGRVRCATFRDQRGPGAIFHFTATQVATADQLALDSTTRLLATEPDGLVLVAGPAGSDKSAIVSAFVDIINRQRGDYVITLEPQVRVIHEHHQALISQREMGTDLDRGLAMARAALRENPDVLVLEDVASGELVSLALDAANHGRLAIVSLEAGSTAEAVQRLIELVPAERRSEARLAMAQSFRGAVAQLLLRKASGGRIAAREVLTGTSAVARLIAEGTLSDLSALLDAGRSAGMAPMVDALVGYVQTGVVDVREASRRAPDRARLIASLKTAGVDTAAVDRLN